MAKFNEAKGENEYFPLYEVASSRLARKTHVDIMNKVQVNAYVAGLHAEGSDAVYRYTNLEIPDRFALMNAAFGQKAYHVNPDLSRVKRGRRKTEPMPEPEPVVPKPKRGRPRKLVNGPTNSTSLTSTTTPTPDSLNGSTASSAPKRRPGRPRKEKTEMKPKRKPGRPRKDRSAEAGVPKRKPGRPRKTPAAE